MVAATCRIGQQPSVRRKPLRLLPFQVTGPSGSLTWSGLPEFNRYLVVCKPRDFTFVQSHGLSLSGR